MTANEEELRARAEEVWDYAGGKEGEGSFRIWHANKEEIWQNIKLLIKFAKSEADRWEGKRARTTGEKNHKGHIISSWAGLRRGKTIILEQIKDLGRKLWGMKAKEPQTKSFRKEKASRRVNRTLGPSSRVDYERNSKKILNLINVHLLGRRTSEWGPRKVEKHLSLIPARLPASFLTVSSSGAVMCLLSSFF